MNKDLDKTLIHFNSYVKNKGYSNSKIQNILSDYFFRYLNNYDKEKKKLIDCIKCYHKSNECKEKYNKLMNDNNLGYINETNKLLLMKCVYVENQNLFSKDFVEN